VLTVFFEKTLAFAVSNIVAEEERAHNYIAILSWKARGQGQNIRTGYSGFEPNGSGKQK
jgi:hypothetical protein